MIVDGRKIADEIVAGIGNALQGKKLGIVVGVSDPATESFIKTKTRVAERLGVEVIRGELEDLIQTCDGILVQLPHPRGDELVATIPSEKDLDAIGASPRVLAPVAGAVKEVLERAGVEVKNKKAVVVGAGKLVGQPCAALLQELGATVFVITTEQGSLAELKDADIVVLGAGSPGLIQPQMLKEGVVLIDAGTSEQGGKMAGDADPACAEVASVFTPVPGGIGPIAVAMIFKNLFALTR